MLQYPFPYRPAQKKSPLFEFPAFPPTHKHGAADAQPISPDGTSLTKLGSLSFALPCTWLRYFWVLAWRLVCEMGEKGRRKGGRSSQHRSFSFRSATCLNVIAKGDSTAELIHSTCLPFFLFCSSCHVCQTSIFPLLNPVNAARC